ncbi:UDP-N-acetylmuramoyl-L-alanine--D-glutamate ligase [Candidatus Hydrogenedentota bacterium]
MLNLSDKKVLVVGLGRTGVSVSKLLAMHGAAVTVTDFRGREQLESQVAALSGHSVEFRFGEHDESMFLDADLIVPSPGVPEIDPIKHAIAYGIEVLSELEVASRFCMAPVFAITGTNGKTTATAFLHELFTMAGYNSVLVGNNDLPFSSVAARIESLDAVVLEVSSYQLIHAKTFHPRAAVLLNITPDHLERHGTMGKYRETKYRIFRNQTEPDLAILNADDPLTRDIKPETRAETLYFSQKSEPEQGVFIRGDGIIARVGGEERELASVSGLKLRGKHNIENIAGALAASLALPIENGIHARAVREFRGVEHRIEPLDDVNGVHFYNDSKSTNIESLRVALDSFGEPVVLIAGGRGKGIDYAILSAVIEEKVKGLALMGEDAGLMESAWGELAPTLRAASLGEGVERAFGMASPGDTVLFSPACASFDMFDNFEHRGRCFKEEVKQLGRKEP